MFDHFRVVFSAGVSLRIRFYGDDAVSGYFVHYANTRNPAFCLGCELISDGKLLHVFSAKKLQISAQMLKSPFRLTVCFVETQINRHPSKRRTKLKPKHLRPSHSSLCVLPLNNNTAEKRR